MKRLLCFTALSAVLLFPLFLVCSRSGGLRSVEADQPPENNVAPGPCVDASLSPQLPHEVKQQPGQPIQTSFDCFSWQSLVALNWAAGARNGEPDPGIPFGHTGRDGLVVWATYKQTGDVLLPTGANPCGCDTSDPKCRETCWNTNPPLPQQCGELGTAPEMGLLNTSKSGSFLDGQAQAVPNVWLTDQKKNLARYEVRMNQDVFDFITANKYYDGKNQWGNPNATFILPSGMDGGPAGAVDLKAAWRIVEPAEEKRFFTVTAAIIDTKIDPKTGYPDKNGSYMTCNKPGEGPCCVRRVGLVGFHIAHKVKDRPQWVWSTFEHVDNAPIQGQPPDPTVSYSFNNPKCGTGPECVPNQNPRKAHLAVTVPVQVERVIQKNPVTGQPLPLLPKDINDQWHGLVKGTVWENYVLVSTQWPTNPSSPKGNPEPVFLANTVLETYNQVPDPNTPRSKPSSCIDCHFVASGLNGNSGDFSFLFSKAQPRRKSAPPSP
jgi:hypothetical protein